MVSARACLGVLVCVTIYMHALNLEEETPNVMYRSMSQCSIASLCLRGHPNLPPSIVKQVKKCRHVRVVAVTPLSKKIYRAGFAPCWPAPAPGAMNCTRVSSATHCILDPQIHHVPRSAPAGSPAPSSPARQSSAPRCTPAPTEQPPAARSCSPPRASCRRAPGQT